MRSRWNMLTFGMKIVVEPGEKTVTRVQECNLLFGIESLDIRRELCTN